MSGILRPKPVLVAALIVAGAVVLGLGVWANFIRQEPQGNQGSQPTGYEPAVVERKPEPTPSTSPAVGEGLVIRYPRAKSVLDTRNTYHNELLQAAMERTVDDYGPFTVLIAPTIFNELRERRALINNSGELDVVARPTSIADEKVLTPVRIPIDKGLLGYRVFLIRRDSEAEFAAVTSLDQLKALRLGQGRDWNDVEIYESQGFNVVTGSVYEGLFEMLVQGRFDYFPRGVDEYLDEYQARKQSHPNLHVEETILLYYPFPRYFWVANSEKSKLIHKRLTAGLERMIGDGSFDRIFWKHRGESIRKAGLDKRRIFHIKNPFLPKTVPLGRAELWIDPLAIPQADLIKRGGKAE